MSGPNALRELETAAGASFRGYCGLEEPDHFGNALAEYDALHHQAGLLDICSAGKLRVTGRDRQRYLNNMLTNDIRKLASGSGCYAALLTRQGLMESDLWVFAGTDELWLECPGCSRGQVLASLKKHIVSEDVVLEDLSDAIGILSIQGPKAGSIIERRLGVEVASLNPLEHRELGPGGRFFVRRNRSGFDGFDLWLPHSEIPEGWRSWTGEESVRPAGMLALNWARTEAGIPWYGVDMDDRTLPMEMGLDDAISMTKGCYRGQEIVARIKLRGHLDRRLAGIAVDHNLPPSPAAEVFAHGERVGAVTSAVMSPRLAKPLALAVVKTAYLQPGTRVDVSYEGTHYRGTVLTLPLHDKQLHADRGI